MNTSNLMLWLTCERKEGKCSSCPAGSKQTHSSVTSSISMPVSYITHDANGKVINFFGTSVWQGLLNKNKYLIGFCDRLVQFDQRLSVVVLGIYDEYQGTTAAKNLLRVECWIKEVYLSREIPNLNKGPT